MLANAYADSVCSHVELIEDETCRVWGNELANYAITQKAINYANMAMYNESISLVDSVLEARHDWKKSEVSFLKYIKILSRIELGHYQVALKEATELYNESKSWTINQGDNKFEAMAPARAQAFSQICSGYANLEMNFIQSALNNFRNAESIITQTEAVDTITGLLTTQLLEIQETILTVSEYIQEPQVAMQMVQTFLQNMEDFKTKKHSNIEKYKFLNEVFVEDYALYAQIYLARASCLSGDTYGASKAFQTADSILIMNREYMSESIMADYYREKSNYYSFIKRSDLSVAYADSAATLYKAIEKPKLEVKALIAKMDGLNALGVKDIYPLAKRIIALNDSVATQKINSNASEMQTLMGMDKLAGEKADLERRQQLYIMFGVAFILGALLFIFYLRHRATQKEKAILAQQKELLKIQVDEQTKELREQKETIEAANRSITDSITYALHIQQAILPSFDIYAGNEGQPSGAFCFYQPCHIVSGDFYWAAKRGRNTLFACCDCTGHGVPGGFMSMLGTSVLADAVKNPNTEGNLAELLEVANEQLLYTLEQSGDKDSRDGMDMALIEYNPDNSTISLASANRTSMLFINGEWIQHKGVKRGIGERTLDRNTRPFQTEVFNVKKGDRIFLFSDGYPDQFGGPRNKKIGNKGVTAILEQTNNMPFNQLYQFISDKYWEWRGDCEQLDDISMLCVEI
ncbi:MAG: SpoIIE family protein phosphatase [Bacteroidia bacterium]|nr:SpoIIE family protein phosphatase [Bacteroidia bacterium]